jgi:hypothetical protein
MLEQNILDYVYRGSGVFRVGSGWGCGCFGLVPGLTKTPSVHMTLQIFTMTSTLFKKLVR